MRISLKTNIVAVAGATALAFCAGASVAQTEVPVANYDEAAASLLPADKREVVEVVAAAGVPPYSFVGDDGATLDGVDADLAKALGEVLGVRFNLTNISFERIRARLLHST